MALAKTCDHLEVLTFDMEKTNSVTKNSNQYSVLQTPTMDNNCGVHSGKTGKGLCYVWVEGTAGRVAQEVGSALRKHLSLNLDLKVKELVLWSHSCGGQNRNIKLTLLLYAILEENENLEKKRFTIYGSWS